MALHGEGGRQGLRPFPPQPGPALRSVPRLPSQRKPGTNKHPQHVPKCVCGCARARNRACSHLCVRVCTCFHVKDPGRAGTLFRVRTCLAAFPWGRFAVTLPPQRPKASPTVRVTCVCALGTARPSGEALRQPSFATIGPHTPTGFHSRQPHFRGLKATVAKPALAPAVQRTELTPESCAWQEQPVGGEPSVVGGRGAGLESSGLHISAWPLGGQQRPPLGPGLHREAGLDQEAEFHGNWEASAARPGWPMSPRGSGT